MVKTMEGTYASHHAYVLLLANITVKHVRNSDRKRRQKPVAPPRKDCYTSPYTSAVYKGITRTLQEHKKPLNTLFEEEEMKMTRNYKAISMLMTADASNTIELKGGKVDPDGKTVWYDAQLLGVEGKGWQDAKSTYERLPVKAKGLVSPDDWKWSQCSAGLSVRFATDAANIRVRWTLAQATLMPHLADLGVNGIDLYYRDEKSGAFRYCPGDFKTIYPKGIVNATSFNLPASKEYVLNLPPYNSVTLLEIGIPGGKTLSKLSAQSPSNSIVFYGTSITQGAHVSRPGMSATTIVRRKLDVPVINLGFCGSGRMEMVMADLLSELDPSIYVLDCLWNMTANMVSARAEPFIKKLRETRPTTPIVLVEDLNVDDLTTAKGDALRKVYEKLIAQGDRNLYLLPNKGMLGDDGDGLADDRHPNDAGMVHQADVFIKCLGPILTKQKSNKAQQDTR